MHEKEKCDHRLFIILDYGLESNQVVKKCLICGEVKTRDISHIEWGKTINFELPPEIVDKSDA